MDGAALDRPIMTRAVEVVGPGPVRPATPDEHRSVALDHQGEDDLQEFREPVDDLARVRHVVQDDGLETAVMVIAHHHAERTVGSVFEAEDEVDDVASEAAIGERQVPGILR